MKVPTLKFRSVRAKTLFIILPLVSLILVSVVSLAFIYSDSIIVKQSNDQMNQQLQTISYNIQDRITAASKVPEVFARTVEDLHTKFSLDDYHTIASHNLEINKDLFGVGIFFEPNAYQTRTKYFSTYALWDNNKIITSEEYSDPSFDYPNQDFYKTTVEQIESSSNKKSVIFSDPYFDDVRELYMVTATVPMFNSKEQFIGVTTSDLILSKIKQIISETKVGETGWAFLLDKNGTYLAGPDTDKIMKEKLQEDKDATLANLGKTILAQKNGNLHYGKSNENVHVYFQEMPGTHWILAIALPDKELVAPIHSLIEKVILVGLVGIALIIIVIFLYSRDITSHIKKVNELSHYLSQGDFTQTIPVTTRDEFGQMLTNFNQTTGLLKQMFTKISDHANYVASTSEQLTASAEQSSVAAEVISSTIQEVANGAEHQMQGSKESARAMEELTLGVQRVAASCSIVREVSQVTSDMAFQGNEIIQNAVMNMNLANQTVNETSDIITRLSERIKKINNIIEVMSEISTRTNLLSLNASIEAARAGEYGRGFSVVATEIRNLAEQSRNSATQVKAIIEVIQSDTMDAVNSIKIGTQTVERGTNLVQEAGESFNHILQDIDSMVGQIEEISASTEEMSAGSEQVTATVEELSRIAAGASDNSQSVAASSQEQLASMEEITTSSKSLILMVQELQELISQFKV
ncbi:methyl-accepting chemotaxis protein [Paenibacillus sp. N3.4]|uniref:methyl-accepting chemotaxis protein n=1 Tax=Paenibacillus sp. N3.4 TaxID=2603222 RepID=UPI0011C77D02|nr:methyl-accepting chemotaxis protein [Paenibacillus sp. N3.4]TXK76599.1 HAMP domain-containing protein [Paenibacillus sp. N3.4]